MKTAKQWVDENSQSGPFDTVIFCEDAEALVKEIQTDAESNALEVLGWAISFACSELDAGRDIRKIETPEIIRAYEKAFNVKPSTGPSQQA